jgi:hypothetical protein
LSLTIDVAIIHPSRGRPQVAYETAQTWLVRCGPSILPRYIMGVELRDAPAYVDTLKALQDRWGSQFSVRWFEGPRLEINEPLPDEASMPLYLTGNTKGNALFSESDADFTIGTADNFLPPDGWGAIALPVFKQLHRQKAVIGYPSEHRRSLACHPVVSLEYVDHVDGQVMYPGYAHLMGDAELFLRASLEGHMYLFPPEMATEHKHVYFGTANADDMFRLNNSQTIWARDEAIWQRRKAEITGALCQAT